MSEDKKQIELCDEVRMAVVRNIEAAVSAGALPGHSWSRMGKDVPTCAGAGFKPDLRMFNGRAGEFEVRAQDELVRVDCATGLLLYGDGPLLWLCEIAVLDLAEWAARNEGYPSEGSILQIEDFGYLLEDGHAVPPETTRIPDHLLPGAKQCCTKTGWAKKGSNKDRVTLETLDGEGEIEVAVDVYGERRLKQQILAYFPNTSDDDFVAIRLNDDGTLAEVMVPHGIEVTRNDDEKASPWMIERDGC